MTSVQEDATTIANAQSEKTAEVFKPRMSHVTVSAIKSLGFDDEVESDETEIIEDEETMKFNLNASVSHKDGLATVWSNILLLANVYNFVTFCYFLAFKGFPEGVWLCIEFLVELFLILDLIMRQLFQKIFKDQWERMILINIRGERKKIRILLLILSTIPTSVIIYACARKQTILGNVGIAFVRVLKLLRINQIKQYFDVRDLSSRRNSYLRTCQAALYILLVTHLLACVWLFIARVDPNQKHTWIAVGEFDEYGASNMQRYADSSFFVVSTMTGLGFSYIYAHTNLELFIESIIIFIGVSLYVEYFAYFVVTLYNRNRKRLENMERLEESKKLEVQRNFPLEIRKQIRYYYNNMRIKYENLREKFRILEQLPNSLKSELSLFINSELIQKVNFFQFADPSFILLMSKCLKPKLCLTDNYVVQLGEVATKMYFIKSGIVKVFASDEKTVIAYMSEGTYFGEVGVLVTQKRSCSIKARTNCIFYTISKPHLVTILDQFPIQEKFLKAVAKQRLETTHEQDVKDYDNEFENAVQNALARQESKTRKENIFEIYSESKNSSSKKLMRQSQKVFQKQKPKMYLTHPFYFINYFIIIPFSTYYEIEIDKKKILNHYLQNYLILDIIASIPYDYLLMLTGIDIVYIQWIRLLRLLKFYRVIELCHMLLKYTSINIPIFRISLLAVILIIAGHWSNCILIFITKLEVHSHSRFDGKNLLHVMVEHPFNVQPEIDHMSKYDLYFNLLVSAISFMDFGDIVPYTIAEEIFGLFDMLIGRLFISFIFAEVASYVSSHYQTYNYHMNQRNKVMKWLQLNHISPVLRKRIVRYFDFKWENQRGIEENNLMKELPRSLRVTVKNYNFESLIQNCTVFPTDNAGAINTIIQKLQRRLYPKDEYILKEGELATEMYFILKGEVKVVTDNDVTLAVLKKFAHFGEMALTQSQATLRMTSVMAKTNVVLAVLTSKDFHLICEHYPEFSTRIKHIENQREKDSLLKGIKRDSQERQKLNNNPALQNFLYQKRTMLAYKGSSFGRQLSAIQEESKHERTPHENMEISDSEELSQSHSISGTHSKVMQDQGEQSLRIKKQKSSISKNKSRITEESKARFESSNGVIVNPNHSKEQEEKQILDEVEEDEIEAHNSVRKLKSEGHQSLRQNQNENDIEENVATTEAQDNDPLQQSLKLQKRHTVSSINEDAFYVKHEYKDQKSQIQLFVCHTLRHILLFILVTYNIIFIPLQMGFLIQFDGIFIFMEIMTIIIYLVDLIITLTEFKKLKNQKRQTQPDTPNGSMEHTTEFQDADEVQRKLIWIRLELVTTAIAMMPFSWILQNSTGTSFILNLLRSLRLIKIWPFYKVIQILKRINVNIFRLLEVIITYYLVAHLVSGVLLNIGLTQPDIRKTWLNRVPVLLPHEVRLENNLDGVSHSTLYIHALFLVSNLISHVSIADLNMVSTDERILNSFLIWIFTFFYAFLFANIASIVSDLFGKNFLIFHEKYHNVISMLPKDKIPKELIAKINNYYDYKWATAQGFDEEIDIFQEIPAELKYDIMISRFQEAISSSLIFRNEQGAIDLPMVNSIMDAISLRIYLKHDIIVKAGSFGENLYIILDGEALLIGLNNDLFGIMRSGTHFNNDYGYTGNEYFDGKRIVHVVAKTLTIMGVIDRAKLDLLFEAYPYWKLIVTRLNRSVYAQGKRSLESYMKVVGLENTYENQKTVIENHLTFSEDSIYERLVSMLDEPFYNFIYNTSSKKYNKLDILSKQIALFQQETGIKQDTKLSEQIGSETSIKNKVTMLLEPNHYYQNAIEKLSTRKNISCFHKCCMKMYCNRGTKFRKIVDFINFMNLMYIAIMIPLEIAFFEEVKVSLILEIISVLICVSILFINFRTPIIFKGEYTLSFPLVLKNYYQNDLLLDIVTALPLNLILCNLTPGYPDIIIITILRLVRMIGLVKLMQLFEKFEIYMKNLHILIYMFKAFLVLFLLWHWTACGFFYLNKWIVHELHEENWGEKFGLPGKTLSEQYLFTMYYVIKIVTGVGQKDMITYNDLERVAFLIIMNIGDALFAFAFGLIASVQLHLSENSDYQKFIQKMKNIEEFLASIKAEESQRKRVETYFSYSHNIKDQLKLIESKDFYGCLPYCLEKDVLYHSAKDILEPMFKHFKSDNLIKEVASALSNMIYMPGDYIIYKDQIGEEMYFIVEGYVQIMAGDKNTVLKTLTKGQYFGEISIFMHTKRISYVQAKTFCVVSVLKKVDIDHIILSFPQLAKEFQEEAKKRIDETKKFEHLNRIAEEDEEEEYSVQIQSEEDEEESFLQALNSRLENPLDTHSMRSDASRNSLLKQIGKQSFNIKEEIVKKQKNSANIHPNQPPNLHLPIIQVNKQERLEIIQEINENEPYTIKITDQDAQSASDQDQLQPLKLTAKFKTHSHNYANRDEKESFEESNSSSSDSSEQRSPFASSNVAKAFTSSAHKSPSDPQSDSVKKDSRSRSLIPSSPVNRFKGSSRQAESNNFNPSEFQFEDQDVITKEYDEDNKNDNHESVRNYHHVHSNDRKDLKSIVKSHTQQLRRRSEVVPKTSFEFAKFTGTVSRNLKIPKSKFQRLPNEDLIKDRMTNVDPAQRTARHESTSIRKQPKAHKFKKRWSQISLGKNLMLSQTAGLKLQWTVGK